MKLEELANEVLIDLFEYLDFLHVFRAFYDLNIRFNQLIFLPYGTYHLNFQSIHKHEFNLICQKHLLSIRHRILSLYLSNNDHTPNLPQLFFSYDFNLKKFHRLQSLLLESIHSLTLLNQIVNKCQYLPYFTHLSLLNCQFNDQDQLSDLIRNIWNLSKLKFCKIDHRYPYSFEFPADTSTSSFLKILSLENCSFDLNSLSNLFLRTPLLRYFNGTIKSHSPCERISRIFPSITSIKLSPQNSFDSMKNLFECLPNLSQLTIKIKNIYLNGYDWKKIIRNYFPKLKIFQFKMELKFSYSRNLDEDLHELVKSFETSFWIEEHQWFVRCDAIPTNIKYWIILYTLPYAFNDFLLTNKQWSKSTGMIKNEYKHVQTLTVMNMRGINSYWFFNIFPNISHLKIYLPLNDHVWSFIQSFNQLISLEVMLFEGFSYHPLQILLDRSPYLSSLCLGNYNKNIKILSQLTNKSIYRLDFQKKNTYKRYFDHKQCEILINSSLGQQCQILLINLENRMNILQLIQHMSNLRSFTFQCKDDQGDEEFIHWLYSHLSATYSISRDPYMSSSIQLWIR